jgi:hypothetical protein
MSFYIPKYAEFKQEIILNSWDEETTPYSLILPEPPNKDKIHNFGLTAEQQRWHQPKWEQRKAFLRKLKPYDLDKYEEECVGYRNDGYWLYINGKITWLTPQHWFYLDQWHIDIGFPEYRVRDRDWYYAWKFCVDDPACYGMAYPKHRREGATYRAGCLNYETISRAKLAKGGIQSKTEPDAAKVFKIHIVNPWKRLPRFFRPTWDGSTNPKKELNFSTPSQKVTLNNFFDEEVISSDEALDSLIDFEDSNEAAYDSQKLLFLHNDEVGKTKLANVYKRWHDYQKPCLEMGNRIVGKSLWTSTVAEMVKEGGENFKKIVEESDYGDKLTSLSGQTISGLYLYFVPAHYCLEGFVDHWGNSNTEEAKKFLDNRIQDAKNKGNLEKVNSLKRLYPRSLREAFTPAAEQCAFNVEKLTERIDLWTTEKFKSKWEQGYLEWVHEWDDKAKITRKRFTKVRFVPSTNGRFFLRHRPLQAEMNQVRKDWANVYHPLNNHKFCVGIDPYDHKQVKNQKPSKGASVAKRKRDYILDPDDKPMEQWTTNKYFVRYCERPQGGPDVFYEDMAMLLWWLGCEALIEKNKIGMYNYLVACGMEEFIANRPESTFGVTASSQDPDEKGVSGSIQLKEPMFDNLDRYIENYWLLIDDPLLATDWLGADFDKLTKYDLTVASGLCECLDNKYIRPEDTTVPISEPLFNTYDQRGKESKRIRPKEEQ